jgi:hypothetical protein
MFRSDPQSRHRGILGRTRNFVASRTRQNRPRPVLDPLEPRCLLTITTTQGLPVVAVEGGILNGVVAKFTDTGAGTLSSSVDWGDGSAASPGVVVADPSLPGVFDVVATHIFAEEGQYPITVSVRDTPVIGAPSDGVAASVGVILDAPLTAGGPIAPVVQEGTVYSGPVVTFVDVDPIGTIADKTAIINWGDGSSPQVGVITQPSGPGTGFIVSGTHTFEEGSYPVTVQITDVGGSKTLETTIFTVTDPNPVVAPPPVNPSTTEGRSLTASIGAFTDPNPLATVSDFSATIDWGDASPTTVGLVARRADGTFIVSGSHTYATVGSFPVTFSVADVGGGALNNAAGVTTKVADAPLTAVGSSISGPQGIALPVTTLVATFTDAGPTALPAHYTATIDWGDGTGVVPASSITSAGSPNGVTISVLGGHTYVKSGVYQLTVQVTDADGAVAIGHGVAAIGNVPPTASTTQPTVNGTEGVPLGLVPVASFVTNSGTPAGVIGAVTATIDWGDGSPRSTGLITQPGGPGTPFIVSGNHTYADSGVNGGIGTYPILVTVFDGGATLVIQNTANIADVAINLSGQLNPTSDSGKFNNDGITNVKTPKFFGKSEPGSIVTLSETPTGGGSLVTIGQGVTNASGNWSITSSQLADGSYNISATAVDKSGHTTAGPVVISTSATGGPLVIDTVGPRVIDAFFDRLHGVVYLTFQDDRSGMLPQSLTDAANYTFNKQHQQLPGRYIVTSLPTVGGFLPTDPVTVSVTINDAQRLRGGSYFIVARSKSVLLPSGIQDLAGNALDGEFYGPSTASGNGVPGGDFVANLKSIHNVVSPPATVIGTPHPNDPAGHFPKSNTKTQSTVGAHKPVAAPVKVVAKPVKVVKTTKSHG